MTDDKGLSVGDELPFEKRISPEQLARKPRKPAPADCCGNGCTLCVNDIYEQELAIWESECMRELLCGNREQDKGPVISPDYYKAFKLQKIRKVTECCSIYKFAVDDFTCLGFTVGQHLIMRACINDETTTRQYTPISSPTDLGFFEVLIKVYPQGVMSRYIKTLEEGASVEWRGPFGKLDYKPNTHKHLLLLAAGTGIAPMIQVMRHVTSADEDFTTVRLLFGVDKYDGIYLKKELDELKRFWNISILYCLSAETKVEKPKYGDELHYGRIDEPLLETEISRCREPPHVLMCGPNAFNNRFVECLKKRTGPVTWHVF